MIDTLYGDDATRRGSKRAPPPTPTRIAVMVERFLENKQVQNVRNAAATVKAVGFFVGVFVAGGAILASVIEPHVKNDKVFIGACAIYLAMTAILATLLWYYIKHICDPPPFEIVVLKGQLAVDQVNGHHHYTNTREQTVKATRNGVRLVDIRSHWTGNSSKDKRQTESIEKEHKLFDGRDREDDWRVHRWLYLGRALEKSETASVGMHQEWDDDLEPMLPYYREGGSRYKTHSITVIVYFPQQEAPDFSDVQGVIWDIERDGRRPEIGHLPVSRKFDRLLGRVEYSVTVHRPRRNQSYGLRWKWP